MEKRISIGAAFALIAAVCAPLLGGCSSAGAQADAPPTPGQNVYYSGPRPRRSIQHRYGVPASSRS